MSAGGGRDALSTIQRALLARQFHEGDDSALATSEPIALIGMACRYPGGADTPERFWDLVRDGVDAITPVPRDRWDAEDLYDVDPFAPGTINSRWGGFIDDIAGFDAAFFGISPREASRMDPQQRLTLEVAVEALERAGQPLDRLAGTQAGVFMASSVHDYAEQLHGSLGDVDAHSLTGNTSCIIANRLSFLLDLRGPSATIDTACSSSLVAVHLACQSLRTRDSDLAIAGGVNTLLSPTPSVAISKWGLMAPDGRCKTFDARADGFVRSEGCGVVVLKRLADAISDNDPVLAVIRGSAVNQDGRSTAMSAPNGLAQQDVIRRALRSAGVRPEAVSCIEAHGTGTEIGDPIEVEALSEVYGSPIDGVAPLAITAVKTNIGHAEAAAGMAGLIKVVLCLQHETIAPTIHFERLNPYIALDGTRLVVPTTCEPWPGGGEPRLAGVSSFGFGGTNAHVLVEEAPSLPPSAGGDAPHLVLVSAQTPAALEAAAERLADHLDASDADPADVSYTTVRRRNHFDERAAVVGRTREELIEQLRHVARGELRPGTVRGRPEVGLRRRPVFVFSGQGTQWCGMARELLSTSTIFRQVVERCDELLRRHVDWSLLDELEANDEMSRLDQTAVAQPALFAVQVGLARVWQEYGIVPAAVTGHSVGEIAAAHIAGALTLDDAVRVVAHRGRLMQAATGNGSMASIDGSVESVREVIAPYGDRLSIAAINGPQATVISGEKAAMEAAASAFRSAGVEVRHLPVDYAFHSTQMVPHAEALDAAIPDLLAVDCPLAFVSTVDGNVRAGSTLDAEYWARNVRETVQFGPAIDTLASLGCDVFIEIGPHPALGGAMTSQLGERRSVIVPSMRRGRSDTEILYSSLAALHCGGVEIDWTKVVSGRRAVLPLPTYPWEHERFWLAQGQIGAARPPMRADGGHPLLGHRIQSPAIDGALFESELRADEPAFLADHRIGDVILVPAMAFLELGLAAYSAVAGEVPGGIDALSLHAALALADGVPTRVQTHLREGPDGVTFSVSSSIDGERWTPHATGSIRPSQVAVGERLDLDAVGARVDGPLCQDEVYTAAARRGTNFGESFQGLTEVLVGDGEALARISAPPSVRGDAGYVFHPALLDACVHGAEMLLPDADTTYLPIALSGFNLRTSPPLDLWAHIRVGGAGGDDVVFVDVSIHDQNGSPVADLDGLTLVRTDTRVVEALAGATSSSSVPSPVVHRIRWDRATEAGQLPEGPWLIVADAGGVGDAMAAALRDRGVCCETIAPDVELTAQRVAEALDAAGANEVLFLRMLDTAPLASGVDVIEAQRRGLDGALSVAASGVESGPRLWLVSRGAQPVDGSPSCPEQATLAGFGAALAAENPGLACVRVDLDPRSVDDAVVADLLDVLSCSTGEELVGVRDGVRHVARLVPVDIGVDNLAAAPTRLVSDDRGSLDALREEAFDRRHPGEGQIEIRVDAVGLNFRDVLVGLDLYPEHVETFGEECAGEVVRVGAGVVGFRPGDRVVAMGSGAFADYLVTDARLAAAIPDDVSAEEAATISIAFLTAYHSLVGLAGLRSGERVLVHAGAGGVGMAAIQIALHLGAEVLATAGTPEKRRRLTELGVAHTFDSRSLDFADGVLTATGGRGVDVVLNSLSDDFIARSFDVLVDGGRFLEIGRRAIWSEERAANERPDVAYSIVFLGDLSLGDPASIAAMYQELLPMFRSGELSPLPRTVFEKDRAVDAFRFMAQARHVGKIVVRRDVAGTGSIDPDATYLVTGGTGGIGGSLARCLVELGARHIALVGRNERDESPLAIVADLEALGADVRVLRADVSVRREVERLIDELDETMPPLRGIVHASGVNDDALLQGQSWERFRSVLGPKLAGTWHLHELTIDRPLTMFVVVSSASAVLGASGQLNYAAANAFLDGFAEWRNGATGVGVSIGWGPWDRVGMTARLDDQDIARLRRRGLVPMPAEVATGSFADVVGGRFARSAPAHVVVVDFDRTTLEDRALLAELRRGGGSSPAPRPLLDEWTDAVPGLRRSVVTDFVVGEAMKVLGLPRGSTIAPRQPFNELGLDSLMAVELRNAVGVAVGTPQPATLLFDHPTTDALVGYLLDLVEGADVSGRPRDDGARTVGEQRSSSTGPGAGDADVQNVADLTEEEAEALLLAELGEMDGHA